MVYLYDHLHVHVLLLIGTADFDGIDTDVSAIDILVNIFGVVVVNKILLIKYHLVCVMFCFFFILARKILLLFFLCHRSLFKKFCVLRFVSVFLLFTNIVETKKWIQN